MNDEKQVIIKIDTWTFIRFWLVVIGFLAVGGLLWSMRVGLGIVLTAIFFAVALNPIVSKLSHILSGTHKKRRKLAVTLSYLMVIIVLGGLLAIIVPAIIRQTGTFITSMPDIIASADSKLGALYDFANGHGLGEFLQDIVVSAQSSINGIANDFQTGFISGAGSFFSVLASVFLVVVLTYLFLADGSPLMDQFWAKQSGSEASTKLQRTLSRMSKAISNYVNGQLTVALIDALFSVILIFVISIFTGVPIYLCLPLGLLMGIMCLIPMFGATIGTIIAGILLAFNSLPAAIIFVAVYFIYQQIENNIIVPKIHANRSDLPALVVLIAITIGLFMNGIVGGILAVPIVNCLRVIYEEYGAKVKKAVRRKS
ncbi:MAG: AI-2E family transporter [Candidatus Nomurabacteria bacterium]|jgi:predicted PurR-regulated permease PerM|nr:AI-2E family transporter [Candidatus Nomurabacteria bacterium]